MREHVLVAVVVGVGGAGCVTNAFQVTQAGTVPAPRPMLYDGQPIEKGGIVEGRSTTVLTPVGEEPDGTSGNYIAHHHSDLILRGARGNSDAGIELGLAWTEGSEAAAPNLGPRPEATAAITTKFTARHSLRLADNIRLGAGFSFGFVSVPIRESAADTERDEAPVFELALVPSYRTGAIAIFGGLNFTTETYVPRTIVVDDSYDTPEAISRGAVVMSAGASYSLPSGLHLMAQLAIPTASDLARHGLQLDLGVGFEFGSQPQPRPPGPPPPPPGYYYPPPPNPTPPPTTPGGGPPGGTAPSPS